MIQSTSCENKLVHKGLKLLLEEEDSEERKDATIKECEDIISWCEEELKRRKRKESLKDHRRRKNRSFIKEDADNESKETVTDKDMCDEEND